MATRSALLGRESSFFLDRGTPFEIRGVVVAWFHALASKTQRFAFSFKFLITVRLLFLWMILFYFRSTIRYERRRLLLRRFEQGRDFALASREARSEKFSNEAEALLCVVDSFIMLFKLR